MIVKKHKRVRNAINILLDMVNINRWTNRNEVTSWLNYLIEVKIYENQKRS